MVNGGCNGRWMMGDECRVGWWMDNGWWMDDGWWMEGEMGVVMSFYVF